MRPAERRGVLQAEGPRDARGDEDERRDARENQRATGSRVCRDGTAEHRTETARDGTDSVPAAERDVQDEGALRAALEHHAHLHSQGIFPSQSFVIHTLLESV